MKKLTFKFSSNSMFKQIETVKLNFYNKESNLHSKKGIFLDIDETLSHTRTHYFEKYSKLLGNPENLNVEQLISKYNFTWNVEYWNNSEKFEKVQNETIHSLELHESVQLITGVEKYLKDISKYVPISGYLTARPSVLQNITEEWIKKHNLPKAPVITCPAYVKNTQAWKTSILEYLEKEVIGIIDDNPDLIKEFSNTYTGEIYLYNYAGEMGRNGLNIISCPDWESILTNIKMKHVK